MKILIDTINQIENILNLLEQILFEEYNNLLNMNNNNIDILSLVSKKKILFKKYFLLNNNRIDLEKKYGIFKPYKNNDQLSNTWEKIIKKCVFLRNLNHKKQNSYEQTFLFKSTFFRIIFTT